MMLYMLKEAYDILLIYYLKMNRKHNMIHSHKSQQGHDLNQQV